MRTDSSSMCTRTTSARAIYTKALASCTKAKCAMRPGEMRRTAICGSCRCWKTNMGPEPEQVGAHPGSVRKDSHGTIRAATTFNYWRFVHSYPRPTGIHSPMMETTGCGTAIVTPFKADGAIDEQALRALVRWQIDAGIDFLVACGSTGEAATLDEGEWLDTIRIVVDAAARQVPVWAGCTHNSTRTLLRQAALLRDMEGVDAILSANPYYNKPSQEGQFNISRRWQMRCIRSPCAFTTYRGEPRRISSH